MARDYECPNLAPFAFVFGSPTQIAPGQRASISLSFVQDRGGQTFGELPKFFQMSSEIVVGVTTGEKSSYSLYNLTFDRVGMPVFKQD